MGFFSLLYRWIRFASRSKAFRAIGVSLPVTSLPRLGPEAGTRTDPVECSSHLPVAPVLNRFECDLQTNQIRDLSTLGCRDIPLMARCCAPSGRLSSTRFPFLVATVVFFFLASSSLIFVGAEDEISHDDDDTPRFPGCDKKFQLVKLFRSAISYITRFFVLSSAE